MRRSYNGNTLAFQARAAGSIPARRSNNGTRMDDIDVLTFVQPKDLWIYDKFILSKYLGYRCGPAGTVPDNKDYHIVRPCVNFRMMSRGAEIVVIDDESQVPDGFFWCELFSGRHLTFDYRYGQQVLAAEGFRDDPRRLDRFSRWKKVTDQFQLPPALQEIADRYEWLNVEVIGDNIIEAHLRYNDDFSNHDSEEIVPVWKETFYESRCGDRVGFILK